MTRRSLALRGPLDLAATLGPLVHGRGDRTIRLRPREAWLTMRLASGPATLRLQRPSPTELDATAWGDGADEALAGVEALVGEHDEPERLVPRHPVVRELARRYAGLRLPRTGRVFAALVPSVIEQKVTGTEAFRAYAALLRQYGEPAPGPAGLLLPPKPETLTALPYHAYHPLGIERRRAEVLRRAAPRATWLEALLDSVEA
ncbi:MAG: DNA-3-methyladenine glycosylase 2 family protein, partial [Thermoleophilaceae bacterium]